MSTSAGADRLGPNGGSRALATLTVLAATLAAGLALAVTAGTAVAAPAAAAPSPTVLFTETFDGTTAAGFSTLSTTADDGDQVAPCLLRASTSRTISGAPAPATCPSGTVTADEPAGLRLTREVRQDAGGVFFDDPVPLASGLDVTFDARQHTMSDQLAGDGMALVLAITPPGPSTVPTRLGQPGRALGYAEDGVRFTPEGLPRTWLGFGLDVVGSHNVADCAVGDAFPNEGRGPALTVRGPGDGTDGYCLRGSERADLGVVQPWNRERVRPTPVPAEVAVNPSDKELRLPSGHFVPERSWLFVARPYDTYPSPAPGDPSERDVLLTGALPSAEDLAALDIPSSWLTSEGLPRRLSVGWTASTGGIRSTQELSNVRATTLGSAAPTFEIDLLEPEDGRIPFGDTSSIRVAPRVSTFAADEVQGPFTTTVTLPHGVAASSATSVGQRCTAQDSEVTCEYDGQQALAPGRALPEIEIEVDAGSPSEVPTAILARVSTDTTSSEESFAVTIGKRTQRITGFDLPPSGRAGETVTLAATGGTTSGQPVTYRVETDGSSTPACTVSGTTLTLTRRGVCTVLADQEGDDRHEPARQQRRRMDVSPGTPVATLTVPTTAVYGAPTAASLRISPAGSGQARLLLTGPSPGAPVTVGDDVDVTVPQDGVVDLTLPTLEPGTYTVGASFSSSDLEAHESAEPVEATTSQIEITKIAQSITLTAPASGQAGQTATVTATGGASGQRVVLDVADESDTVCQLTGDRLALLRRGSCVVTATQAGDSHHQAAPRESTTVAVDLSPTTTTLTLPATATSEESVPVQVTTTSGVAGTVQVLVDDVAATTVAVDGTGPTTVNLTDLAVGARSVRATFVPTSTETHGESSSTTSTVTVGLAPQSIDLTVAGRGRAGDRLPVTATGGASGNPVVLSVDASSDGGACALDGSRSGATLRLLGAGSCVVRAEQAGGPRHGAAPAVVRTVVVERNATATTLELAAASTRFGTSVTALARVTDGVAGSVQFVVDGTDAGRPVAVSSGQARSGALTASDGTPLGVGRHTVSAIFRPDSERMHAWSSAPNQVLLVQKAVTTTTTSLEGPDLVATVRAAGDGLGTPTGRVTFSADGRSIGTAELLSGVARLARPAGTTGEVVATYGGDTVFASSASSAVREPLITAKVTSRRPVSDAGWYRTPVVVTFTCTATTAPLAGPCPAPVVLGGDGAGQSVERSIRATDGSRASVLVGDIDIDRSRPEVEVQGVDPGHLYRNGAPRGRCRATDPLSGVESCRLQRRVRDDRVVYVARTVDRAGNRSSARVVVRTAR